MTGCRSATAPEPLIARLAPTIMAAPAEEADARSLLEPVIARSDELSAALTGRPEVRDFLVSVAAASPFLRDLMLADADRLARILSTAPEERVRQAIAGAGEPVESTADLKRALRRARQAVALAVALADLGGIWSVTEVTRALSGFADASVSAAVRHLLREAIESGRLALADGGRGAPEAGSGFVVLGLGKLGGQELNYSSDIDLIVLWDRRRFRSAGRREPDALVRQLTRDLTAVLQDRTADGYAFRVDLRLRPDPSATPIAVPLDSALAYYATRGRTWERAALIKARPIAGDPETAEEFLRAVHAFVWRRQLDYSAVEDVDSLKQQLHVVRGHGTITVPGHNLKLGRGGIREIEFFTQGWQLVAGGRDPSLRGRETVPMLQRLAQTGWIGADAAAELSDAYARLRAIEHRLQMIADEQTHAMPWAEPDLERIARLGGAPCYAAFAPDLAATLGRVYRHYRTLFDPPALEPVETGPLPDDLATLSDDALQDRLAALGFREPADAVRAVRRWQTGREVAIRSPRAQKLLNDLSPAILARLARSADADDALRRFDLFLSQLPAGVQLFALLRNHPELLDLLGLVMGTAPRLARILTRRTRLLDVLLDPAFFGQLPDAADLERRFREAFETGEPYETVLDRARIVRQEQSFLIGVRQLTGSLDAVEAGFAYARLAEIAVRVLLGRVRAEFEAAHGIVPGGAVAVLAMGKLGGMELAANSDLDLILLYDHAPDVTASGGRRPLAPSQYFARLTQRLVAALSAPTAEGTLYPVDFRLRPSGNAGPLATRIDSFEQYHRTSAWTWERMAMTRARCIAGDASLCARATASIDAILTLRADRLHLAHDVLAMRERIAAEKGSADVWALKTARGGLLDCEFIAQFLQLAYAHLAPAILTTRTADVIDRARALDLIGDRDHALLARALAVYQSLTQVLRLALDEPFRRDTAPAGLLRLLRRAADAPDIDHLEADLKDLQRDVAAAFARLVVPT